jgi:hypothetical protein
MKKLTILLVMVCGLAKADEPQIIDQDGKYSGWSNSPKVNGPQIIDQDGRYSDWSSNNPKAGGLQIIDQNGKYSGRFTNNRKVADSTSNPSDQYRRQDNQDREDNQDRQDSNNNYSYGGSDTDYSNESANISNAIETPKPFGNDRDGE